LEASDILGLRVEAHGKLQIDRARWQESQPRLLDALNTLAGEPARDLLAAVEQFGWEIQRETDRPTLLVDHNAGSGNWQAGHVRFLADLATMGFEGTLRAESVDDEVAVEYALYDGTMSASASAPEFPEDHGAVVGAAL